jgi:spore maturation protein CgeB
MNDILLVCPGNAKLPSFEYGVKNALQKLGHNVSVFDYRKYQLHRLRFTRNILNKRLLNVAKKNNPDLVLVLKGEQLQEGIIQKITNLKIKTANWILDDPFGRHNKFNKLNNINEYDDFFVFDPYYVKELKEKGQSKSHYLPCCTNVDLYKEQIPIKIRKYKQDISFIGTYQTRRKEILNSINDRDMKIWGYHWDKLNDVSPLKNNVVDETLHGTKNIDHTKKICKIFNQTKINMNVHYDHSIESVNIRTFDVPATKSFLLTDHFKELKNLFKLKKEMISYQNYEELNELIDYYVDNKNERDKLALAGYKRVLKEHDVVHRMKTLLKTIKK